MDDVGVVGEGKDLILSYSKSVGDLERFMIKSLEWDIIKAYQFLLSIPTTSTGLVDKARLNLASCIICFYDKLKVTYDGMREKGKDKKKNVLKDIDQDSGFDDLRLAVQDVSYFLIMELRLNHITNKRSYDSSNAESENEEKGM